jgi:hypothetical protein
MNPSGADTSRLSDRPERERDTFLTAGIFFSLDRCLLMGDTHVFYEISGFQTLREFERKSST